LVNLLVRSEESPIPMNYVETFHLWSRKHQIVPQSIVAGSQQTLIAAHFYPRHTYVIVHGFLGTGTDDWIISIKNALLQREDCNVISVSWKSGTTSAGYYVIQARVKDVGEDISKLLRYLEQMVGLTPDLIHLVGHSLGAHVVGFVGKHFNGTIPRITGLDPAGLMYHQAEPSERLDKSDATFVDIIHTHGCTTILSAWSDCYGIDENLGDADFWPNGGERQPACQEGGDGDKLVRAGSDCNHGMAYVLYAESIQYPTSTTRYLARPCTEWRLFNNGACPCYQPGHPVQYMGYNVNPAVSGIFYLNTSNTAPYALLDYDCPPGSFSALQLIGLILLSILMLIMMLVVVAVVVQQYYGIPIFTRLRAALGIEGVTFHGLPESTSSQLLAADHQVVT
ncbi:hypothetical protein SK128_026955, partial [Halocaridina rubra]